MNWLASIGLASMNAGWSRVAEGVQLLSVHVTSILSMRREGHAGSGSGQSWRKQCSGGRYGSGRTYSSGSRIHCHWSDDIGRSSSGIPFGWLLNRCKVRIKVARAAMHYL